MRPTPEAHTQGFFLLGSRVARSRFFFFFFLLLAVIDSDPFYDTLECAKHFQLSVTSPHTKRCILSSISSSVISAPTSGNFGDNWGFVCGHLWSGHLGFWFFEDRPALPQRGHDGSTVALDRFGYGADRCPPPFTKEQQHGISICTVYLNYAHPARSAPVTRLYPVCEVLESEQQDASDDGRQRMRIGYAIDNSWAAGAPPRERANAAKRSTVLAQFFSCPDDWRGRKGSACTPALPSSIAAASTETPQRMLHSWTQLDGPIRSAISHAAATTSGRRGGRSGNTVLFTTASHGYLSLALTWSAYHRRRGVPVVVVALDLPVLFALRAANIPSVYHRPLSGRSLTPWCVERWLMPSWRLAHHAKAAAAAAAVGLGYHTGVLDLDVFLDDESPAVDWAALAEEAAIAHSGTFDFYFGYTSASEPARQMWENILLSVLHGAWDQSSWGWWGDRFRQALNARKLAPPNDDAARPLPPPVGSTPPPRPPVYVPAAKKELVITGRHEHLPMVAHLPGNVTFRRLQNREGQLTVRLKRAIERMDREEGQNLKEPQTIAAQQRPSPLLREFTARDSCVVRWYRKDDENAASDSSNILAATPCGTAWAASSAALRLTPPERWRRRRLCTAILVAVARALDEAFPLPSLPAMPPAAARGAERRVALLDKDTWNALDVGLLNEWFDASREEDDGGKNKHGSPRLEHPSHRQQKQERPGDASTIGDRGAKLSAEPLVVDLKELAEAVIASVRSHDEGNFGRSANGLAGRVSKLSSACEIQVAGDRRLSWLGVATTWEQLRQQWQRSALHPSSSVARATNRNRRRTRHHRMEVVVQQLDLFLAPPLPGRRTQGFNCLPPPFHRAASCAKKCEHDRRNNATTLESYQCTTFLGDSPLSAEHCPGTVSFSQLRCQHDSLTPSCTTNIVKKK